MASASIQSALAVVDLTGAPVGSELLCSFDPSDPFALKLSLEPDPLTPGLSEGGSWVLERLMLARGLLAPVGEGLVRLVPFSSHAGLFLSLELADDSALDAPPITVVVEIAPLASFLATASMFVPLGDELEHVDLDAELIAILDS